MRRKIHVDSISFWNRGIPAEEQIKIQDIKCPKKFDNRKHRRHKHKSYQEQVKEVVKI